MPKIPPRRMMIQLSKISVTASSLAYALNSADVLEKQGAFDVLGIQYCVLTNYKS